MAAVRVAHRPMVQSGIRSVRRTRCDAIVLPACPLIK
jgi:hypothetical protein